MNVVIIRHKAMNHHEWHTLWSSTNRRITYEEATECTLRVVGSVFHCKDDIFILVITREVSV